ncbi:MAG TPA: HlyD family efflux transporter periplasmic adaptor subunit [Thermoanaerobaculia bacterium]|nr:HlyD family efflux transporter periplasmic adaptor subunit [Thermoanaerobaculia bacterium]
MSSASPRASALVSAAPIESGVGALAARRKVAADRPALKSNLVIRRVVQMGEGHWIVKNPDKTQYYSFEEANWELIRLFDGTRTLAEIHDAYQAQFREPLDPALVPEYEESLREMDLLQKSTVERHLEELSRIKEARKLRAEQKAEGGDIMLIPFKVADPNDFLERTQKYVRWIWRPPTVIVALVAIMMTIGVIVPRFDQIWSQTLELYAFLRKPFWDAVQFFAILSCIGAIHELSHGYVCKFYGGEVHDIGGALLYFMPAFYCDTTDALLFPSKWQRLWVLFAGMYIEAIICCIATGLWVASYPDTLLHEVSYKILLFTGVSTIFFNINPLRKIDGYYALASYLEIPELREDSFSYCAALFKKHVLRLHVEVPVLSRRKRRIYLIYGPLAIAFMILIMVFIGKLFYNLYARYFPNLAGVLLVLTLLRLFRKDVRAFLQGLRLVYLDKKEFIMSGRARVGVLVGLAVLLLVLAVPWAPWTLETEAVLQPWTEASLQAPEGATIASVRFHEGDRVGKDDVVAVLESPAAISDLASAAAIREALVKRTGRERDAGDAPALFQAESRAQAAELAVLSEESRLGLLSVRSPIAGRLLTRRTQDLAGRFVSAGAEIARVGDCARLKAEIPVSERLLSYLRPGSRVSMQVRARPMRILHGEIVRVGAAAHELPPTADGKVQLLRAGETPERFIAVVAFANAEGEWLPGMTGRAKILLGRRAFLWRSWRVLRHWFQTVIWW